MKLYTEEQVKMLLEKMSLVTERKNLGVSANFRHRAIEIDKLLKEQTPIELPSYEEIEKQNPFVWGSHVFGTRDLLIWEQGVKWLRDKIQGGNK